MKCSCPSKETTTTVPFISKTDPAPRFKEHREVQNCIDWLERNGFSYSGLELYAPNPGSEFEVLKPLESCGNEEELAILPVGLWKCVKYKHPHYTGSSHWATFQASDDTVVTLKVGYEPIGIHAIMAWEGNIRKV